MPTIARTGLDWSQDLGTRSEYSSEVARIESLGSTSADSGYKLAGGQNGEWSRDPNQALQHGV